MRWGGGGGGGVGCGDRKRKGCERPGGRRGMEWCVRSKGLFRGRGLGGK